MEVTRSTHGPLQQRLLALNCADALPAHLALPAGTASSPGVFDDQLSHGAGLRSPSSLDELPLYPFIGDAMPFPHRLDEQVQRIVGIFEQLPHDLQLLDHA